MHGGISDKIHLSVLRKVERHRCEGKREREISVKVESSASILDLSIEVRPQSNSGDQKLTGEEENEYRQVQGKILLMKDWDN